MYKIERFLTGFLLIAAFSLLYGCSSVKPIASGSDIGVVLMHGKGGTTLSVAPLARNLRRAGFQVTTPQNLPWHRDRIYDKTFEESMLEIDRAVAKLRKKGARHIFVAGHSLGAIAAAGYGARREGLAGIILLAPGHLVGEPEVRAICADDVLKSKKMIDSGKGSKYSNFGDFIIDTRTMRRLKANIFYSWFAPDGPAEFTRNMANTKPGTAILYVVGDRDGYPPSMDRTYAFDDAPRNPKNKFVIISSDHRSTPADSSEVVIDWLRDFK
jgi:pimeloyl-ACP methyl ester carboxylesterase